MHAKIHGLSNRACMCSPVEMSALFSLNINHLPSLTRSSLLSKSSASFRSLTSTLVGTVHKVCHTILDKFYPTLLLSHSATDIGPPEDGV